MLIIIYQKGSGCVLPGINSDISGLLLAARPLKTRKDKDEYCSMQAKSNAAERGLVVSEISYPCGDVASQDLVKDVEALNRKQQNIYPLINRLRKRIELQRRVVASMGVQE